MTPIEVTSEVPEQAPHPQIINMVAPGDEASFERSLFGEFGDAPKPKKERKKRNSSKVEATMDGQPIDAQLERAKSKFASLGSGTLVKRFFAWIDSPLDKQEEEDVDDYFYLFSKKAKVDPSDSWLMMIFCLLILVGSLTMKRTRAGEEIKQLFDKEDKAQNDDSPI